MCTTCAIGCLIIWPVLFPIHVTGGAGNTELDALSFSNVTNPKRYYAHTVIGITFFSTFVSSASRGNILTLFVAYVFYVLVRESLFYANLRQAYLNSPAYADRISSRTVLFMSVPDAYKNEKKLRQVFGDAIVRIWITSDCKELAEKVSQRDRLADRLEAAETRFIRRANSARLKAIKKRQYPDVSADCERATPLWTPDIPRPTHRIRFFGKKVDSIDWLRSRLASTIEEVQTLQRKHRDGEAKYLSAIFVEFRTQNDAQVALQTLSHHQPFHMTPRFIGIPPREVIWSSLNLSWWQRIIRKFLMQGAIAALIIFWSIPSANVGTISNIQYLSSVVPFLGFLNDLPSVIKGAIAGLLPSAALVLLMSLVPIICRSKWLCRTVPSIYLTIDISIGEKCRRTLQGGSRVIHAKCTLLLSGGAGFPCYNNYICGFSCDRKDYSRSDVSQRSSRPELAESIQLLRVIFPSPGPDDEFCCCGANHGARGLQIDFYLLRSHT